MFACPESHHFEVWECSKNVACGSGVGVSGGGASWADPMRVSRKRMGTSAAWAVRNRERTPHPGTIFRNEGLACIDSLPRLQKRTSQADRNRVPESSSIPRIHYNRVTNFS